VFNGAGKRAPYQDKRDRLEKERAERLEAQMIPQCKTPPTEVAIEGEPMPKRGRRRRNVEGVQPALPVEVPVEVVEPSGAIELFDFNGASVRVVIVDNKPVWVAKDVCETMGIVNVSDACGTLEEGSEKITIADPDRNGMRGNPHVLAVTEEGLYRLVFKSTKPEAERVKRWLAHDVLPALRRKGYYIMGEKPEATQDEQEVLLEQLLLTVRRTKKLEAEHAVIRAKVESIDTLTANLEAEQERIASETDAKIAALRQAQETQKVEITKEVAKEVKEAWTERDADRKQRSEPGLGLPGVRTSVVQQEIGGALSAYLKRRIALNVVNEDRKLNHEPNENEIKSARCALNKEVRLEATKRYTACGKIGSFCDGHINRLPIEAFGYMDKAISELGCAWLESWIGSNLL